MLTMKTVLQSRTCLVALHPFEETHNVHVRLQRVQHRAELRGKRSTAARALFECGERFEARLVRVEAQF